MSVALKIALGCYFLSLIAAAAIMLYYGIYVHPYGREGGVIVTMSMYYIVAHVLLVGAAGTVMKFVQFFRLFKRS